MVLLTLRNLFYRVSFFAKTTSHYVRVGRNCLGSLTHNPDSNKTRLKSLRPLGCALCIDNLTSVWQLGIQGHIGWARSMPFASINPASNKSKTNLWNFENWRFWKTRIFWVGYFGPFLFWGSKNPPPQTFQPLKPSQNKKGQKNLGYPTKKQSFYKEKDCFFVGYPKFFWPFLFWSDFSNFEVLWGFFWVLWISIFGSQGSLTGVREPSKIT